MKRNPKRNLTLSGTGGPDRSSLFIVLLFAGSLATSTFAQPVLQHRYSFTEAAGTTTIVDSVGTSNGVFNGSSGGPDGHGNLILDGFGGYVDLQAGLITGYTNITVEAWGSFGGNATWMRLFDFGDTDTNGAGNHCMDLIVHDGSGGVTFETLSGTGAGSIEFKPALDNLGPTHVVLVYDPQVPIAAIYVNGVCKVSSSSITMPFTDIHNTHSYIGKSGFTADTSTLNATSQEFRVYSGVLSPFQIAVDAVTGPSNIVDSATIGSLTNIHFTAPSPLTIGSLGVADVTGDFQKLQGVDMSWNTTLQAADPTIVSVGANLTLTAKKVGTTTVTATCRGFTATQSVTVLPLPEPPPVLMDRYSFNEPAGSMTFKDSVGTNDGVCYDLAHVDGNGNLVLPGNNGSINDCYSELPAHLIDGWTNVSFEFWVSIDNLNPTWGRLLDFGDSAGSLGTQFIDFTPNDNASACRLEVNNSSTGTQIVQGKPALIGQTNLYLVLIFDPMSQSMSIHTNGELCATASTSGTTIGGINDAHSWLGKSSYLGDANGKFTIDEFRIYKGALGLQQIADDKLWGPDQLPVPTLSVVKSGAEVVLSWPDYQSAYNVQTSAKLGAGASWGPPAGNPAPVITNGVCQVTLPMSASATFYRLVK